MRTNNNDDLTSFIRLIALLALIAGLVGMSQAQAAALQIDEPWQSTGSNTGTVDGAALTATASRWRGDFNNDTPLYARPDLWGANALPAGTIGDFFSFQFGANTSDTVTVTLNAALTNPIFYIGDLDVIGATVTVSSNGTNFTSNADGEWVGDTLNVLSGAPQETTGAFATVQYLGTFAAGESFVFDIDYGVDTFSSDNLRCRHVQQRQYGYWCRRDPAAARGFPVRLCPGPARLGPPTRPVTGGQPSFNSAGRSGSPRVRTVGCTPCTILQ